MNRGWVRLWRRIIDDEVFQDPVLLKVFLWGLLKASHKEIAVSVKTGRGVTMVRLKPGQFIFGRHQAAKELLLNPSSTRNKSVKLQTLQIWDIKPDNHFSIVTICNWEIYQADIEVIGQAVGQPKDNQRTQTRIKEFKKETYCVHHGSEKVPLGDGIQEVLDLLNQKRVEIVGGNGLKPITQNKEIKARLTEKGGASVMECCRVILTKSEDRYFRENPQYFHPSTLFRKSNFQRYRDEVEIVRARRARGEL